MSGHSKWSTIKRQKAVTDARRSASFTKHARLIAVAARAGGGDPTMNFRLRLAIDNARADNMPNDNVERAIKAGTGEARGDQVKEIVYEGFGPGGVALMIETVTDNSNRTAGDLRAALSKYGGSLGGQNSVAWMFDRRGVIRGTLLADPQDPDAMALSLLETGATDARITGRDVTIECQANDIERVRSAIDPGLVTITASGAELIPTTPVRLSAEEEQRLADLFEVLDEHPDITNVTTNETA